MNIVFGYGSLIKPFSLVSREVGDKNKIDYTYKEDIRLMDELDMSVFIEKWFEYSEEINIYPVKLNGYKRFYSTEHRNGGMLEIYPEKNSFVNGIIYTNVPDNLYSSVVESEEGYSVDSVDIDKFEFYTEEKPNINEKVKIFYPKKDAPREDLLRHPVYHDGILKSIVFFLNTNTFENDVVWHFLVDFLESTHEYDEESKTWVSLLEKDNGWDLSRVHTAFKIHNKDRRIY